MLYKGRSLLQLPGRRTDGANTFKQLLKESPKSDSARVRLRGVEGPGDELHRTRLHAAGTARSKK